jgi:hypothetical protein
LLEIRLGYEPSGRRFESSRVRHIKKPAVLLRAFLFLPFLSLLCVLEERSAPLRMFDCRIECLS